MRALSLLGASIALALLGLVLLFPTSAPAATAETAPDTDVPLSFAPNLGRTDASVRYLAQGVGYSFFFAEEKAVLSFAKSAGDAMARTAFTPGTLSVPFTDAGTASDGLALELRFVGANPDARLEAGHRAAGTVNQLTGPASDWRSNVRTYHELAYRELWPGIDLVFRGQGGELKYEFHLDAGADPGDIRLDYAGTSGLSLGSEGSMTIHTPLGALNDARPVSYQDVAGVRVPVDSRYALRGDNEGRYGFVVGDNYERSQPLVIDPAIAYSTFVGGSGADSGRAVALDGDGNVYVTGQTAAADYPTTPGAYDHGYNTNVDVFVTKIDSSGAIAYSTFIGGTAFDSGNGIGVDAEGAAYVAGFTGSPNYPTTPGAFDPSANGGSDAFVTKLNSTGSALDYSTFLGGAGFSFEGANGIAIDDEGSAYVTGFTGSGAYPATPGAYDTSHNGRNDVFVTKLDGSGSALAYSTFLGGTTSDTGNAIAVDGMGGAYVTGFTASGDFPATPGAHDVSHNGGNDAFVTRLNNSGSALAYSSFLGGTGSDSGRGIAVDEKGKAAHVTGSTDSADYPTTRRALDATYNGNGDAFLASFDGRGSTLAYSTFLGGAGGDVGNGIAVDAKGGAAYVTGSTDSADYPTSRDADDASYNGGGDAFVTALKVSNGALAYSTFLGGAGGDVGNAIAVDRDGEPAYVTGSTESSDYPTTPGAHDPSYNGAGDVFIARVGTSQVDDDDDDEDGDQD